MQADFFVTAVTQYETVMCSWQLKTKWRGRPKTFIQMFWEKVCIYHLLSLIIIDFMVHYSGQC